MRIGIGTLVWTLVVLGGASLVGRVVHILSVDGKASPTDQREVNNASIKGAGMHLDAKLQHLLWFIQISDLHLSVFQDPTRMSQLRGFASSTVSAISPAVVLASGDLTDAKNVDMLGSKQYIEEWATYKDILYTSGVLNKTIWLDIRGNHDNFNVPSLSSEENFYQKYSIQGQHSKRSYMYTRRYGSDSVSFIGVDASLLPGPRRPFNFI
ncbi:Transmembrane protein 62, partial [Halocaridina rubra]